MSETTYLSPAVLDMVTCAQGYYENELCACALLDPANVFALVGNFRPEISLSAKEFWALLEQFHASLDDLYLAAIQAGLFFDIATWLNVTFDMSALEAAKDFLYKIKCCKAARLGLSLLATDPIIGSILEKSRYGH